MKDMDQFLYCLGAALYQARESAGVSRETLQMKTGIHRNTIARYENGEANPSLKTLITLATALGYSMKVSLGRKEGENETSEL